MQWQPYGLTIRTEKRFLGAGSLGAPPNSTYIYIYNIKNNDIKRENNDDNDNRNNNNII